jgi:23S rRNA (cytidine1920-2'-O)/16S rRNA (cytidine1409-2'-O)-methyltransferase
LVRRGLVDNRTRAADLINAGQVLVSGVMADKASRLVAPGEPLEVAAPRNRFVSRGGEKLDAALARFGIDAAGVRALDAGASTGGFTDCLLRHGAASVVSVDVGHGQIHERLQADPRVIVRERTDVRSFAHEKQGGQAFDLVVADLSFISLRTVAEPLVALARPGAEVVVLVKPQFEAGRREASRGRGVIKDPDVWRRALQGAIGALESAGSSMMGIMASPLRGADGNVEYLVHLRRDEGADERVAGLDPRTPGGGLVPKGAGPAAVEAAIAAAIDAAIAESGV